jgi:RES domain-containing protein
MVLWRISIFSDLSGIGGELAKGRWHTPAEGKRIVYFAEHPALALLETLVNLKQRPEDGAAQFQLLRIETSNDVPIERVAVDSLPSDWTERRDMTQALGNEWLRARETPLLAVPSAPSPESTNYLLNPLHSDAAKVTIAWSRWIRYDKRLFQLSE